MIGTCDIDLCDNPEPWHRRRASPPSAEASQPSRSSSAPPLPPPPGRSTPAELADLAPPPVVDLPHLPQLLRFNQRQIEFVFGAKRQLGDVFRMRTAMPGGPVITSHPDHVRSLFTAKPEQAPSLAGESPLRPILGPNSVLTALGERHMRQRKLLLPPFHGEAIERYAEMIAEATEREIDTLAADEPFALAPRMQAITLDVIMAGIFGVEGKPAARHARAPRCAPTVKQPGQRLDQAGRAKPAS